MSPQFIKAVRWLARATRGSRAVEVAGHPGRVADVFWIVRPGRPTLCFVADYRRGVVRRICA